MTTTDLAPKTTDGIAKDVRHRIATRPETFDAVRPLADRAQEKLRDRLPDMDPADIAAVLLHAAGIVGTEVIVELRADGIKADRHALLGLNVLAVLGERLLTEAAEEPRDA